MASGWEGYGLLYDVEFYKGVSLRDAEEELKARASSPTRSRSGKSWKTQEG